MQCIPKISYSQVTTYTKLYVPTGDSIRVKLNNIVARFLVLMIHFLLRKRITF